MGVVAILVIWPRYKEELLFPHPMEAPHLIWFQSAQQFQRRCLLKTLMPTTNHCLSYRLPWSFWLSGEQKKNIIKLSANI